MNILIEKLKRIVKERRAAGTPDNAIINALKEELQYAVLDFIYNNRTYSHLIMYGGTLLRIVYGLPRMSEDLDFQTDKNINFKKLSEDLIVYFKGVYDFEVTIKGKTERLTGTDCIYINFPNVLMEIGIQGTGIFTILKIKLDINKLAKSSNFGTESMPITKENHAFSIRTYPMATLMASKIAAVLLRTKRGIADEVGDCKPRDIFDLMWYMTQKIIPNLEYLRVIHIRAKKNIEAITVLHLFDMLRKRVGNLRDNLFKLDLATFFYDPVEYEVWYRNWRQRFIMLIDSYEIYEIKKNGTEPKFLKGYCTKDFSSGNRHIEFFFVPERPLNKKLVKFTLILSEYWFISPDLRITPGHRRHEIEDRIIGGAVRSQELTELDYEYIGLFYSKIVDYIKRSDFVMLQAELNTKTIRATADNLNVQTQILLNSHLLEKEKFEDLL